MNPIRLFTLTVLAPLALSACSESVDDAATQAAADGSVPFDGSAPVDTGEAAAQPAPDDAAFDGSVTDEAGVDATPETGGTEPMDSAEPMGGTEPMAEGFGPDAGASGE